eukprot:GSChrysophyteH1.ASY1.ANO1.3250.1 assembled CDS
MKMMMHVQSGVEKGVKRSVTGKPTEVMGYLIGRQCTDDPRTLIITDTEEVLAYQINWLELNGRSKHPCEKFCGWYHSHPFDIEEYSHCYLSNTDVSTQLAWQRSCEKDGDPWLAVVIDPLRSLARGVLELQSFRVYPPEYAAPLNECPDGSVVSDDRTRLTLWGNCWNRYYKLHTSYYMSQLSANVLSSLRDNFLWQRSLSSTLALQPEQQQTLVDRLTKHANDLQSMEPSSITNRGFVSRKHSDKDADNDRQSALTKISHGTSGISTSQCQHGCQLMSKLALFGNPNFKLKSHSAGNPDETNPN